MNEPHKLGEQALFWPVAPHLPMAFVLACVVLMPIAQATAPGCRDSLTFSDNLRDHRVSGNEFSIGNTLDATDFRALAATRSQEGLRFSATMVAGPADRNPVVMDQVEVHFFAGTGRHDSHHWFAAVGYEPTFTKAGIFKWNDPTPTLVVPAQVEGANIEVVLAPFELLEIGIEDSTLINYVHGMAIPNYRLRADSETTLLPWIYDLVPESAGENAPLSICPEPEPTTTGLHLSYSTPGWHVGLALLSLCIVAAVLRKRN